MGTLGVSGRTYPGDDIVPDPHLQSTYSIEIEADPAAIWPWLVQMGYHRGGWYIDAWWDKVIQQYFWPRVVPKSARGEYRPPADRIEPSLQSLAVGDIVPDGPPDSAYYRVVEMESERHLLLHSTTHFQYMLPPFTIGTRFEPRGKFSWVFVLDRIADGLTRLTIRFRAAGDPRPVVMLFKPVIVIADRFHVRQMLNGIKRRAEGH